MMSTVTSYLVTLVILNLFLDTLLVTVTLHSWQQTQNYATWTLAENVAKILRNGKKRQNPGFLTKFLMKSAFPTKNSIFGGKILWSLILSFVLHGY